MTELQTEIIQAIAHSQGATTLSDLEYALGKPLRNDLSEMINRSIVFQNPENSAFHLSPFARQFVRSTARMAA